MTIPLITIRQAEEEDLPHLLELYRQLQPEDPVLSPEKAAEIWQNQSAAGTIQHIIAEIDRKIIGASTLIIIPNFTRRGRPFAVIENVIVDRSYRGNGIGKALMDHSIVHAKEHKCYKIMLMSAGKRTDAHHFYQAVGFDGESKRAFELRL